MPFTFHKTSGVPLKLWDTSEPFETSAMEQLYNVAKLPFIFRHVAGMPDVHWGMGATIGSVIATKGALVPAAVGVDIGCGVEAIQLNLTASDLPDNLHSLRSDIEAAVPHGRTDNGRANDRGRWHDLPLDVATAWAGMQDRYSSIVTAHPKAKAFNTFQHLGTLGTGNHFIEVCLDESDAVWIMLHSGSRGLGNRIGTYFISRAQKEAERLFIDGYLPDRNLAWLVEGTPLFDDYVNAVHFAQDFAKLNRDLMLKRITRVFAVHFGRQVKEVQFAVSCHHNYIAKEHHFDSNVWITRKGAVRAREGDLGIIPGSMGTASYIVRGKGNAESFCSCSHGAGRKMSRGAARKRISLVQHAAAMEGIEARLDADVLDESPAAYKSIEGVMAAQTDLVDVVHTLRQVINVKG